MPDHTISVPAPENTRRFGIPNACNECHKDKSAGWSESKLAAWFPGKRRERAVLDAVAFTRGAAKDPAGEAPLIQIAGDASRPPLIRANALGYLRGYPDAPATAALLAASGESHPALRLVAFLSLTDRGSAPIIRDAQERGLLDPRRTVRMASALGLLNVSSGPSLSPESSAALSKAMSDHASRARFLNDDAGTQLDLGKLFFRASNWKGAEGAVRAALRLDPKISGGIYFLGLATVGQGRVAEGIALLRSVDRKDPHRKDAEAIVVRLTAP
jgi:tetratricopeptide (TPR) repeat protein